MSTVNSKPAPKGAARKAAGSTAAHKAKPTPRAATRKEKGKDNRHPRPAESVPQPSVSSVTASPPPADERVMTVPHVLTPAQVLSLKSVFPGTRFETRPEASPSPNPHGALATIRTIANDDIVNDLKRADPGVRILDVYGSARRNVRYGESVHTRAPIVTPKDAFRVVDLTVNPHVCTCAIDSHCSHCEVFDHVICVDSLYYVQPEQLARVLQASRHSGATLYAVHHVFPNATGVVLDEAQYWRRADGSISMRVSGNNQPYTHPNLDWLRLGSHVCDDGTLVWQQHRTYGPVVVTAFRFLRDQRFVPETTPIPSYIGAVGALDYYGPVQSVVGIPNVFSVGSWVVTRHGSIDISVPKKLLSIAQIYVAGRPRTPALLSAMTAEVRSQIDRNQSWKITDESKPLVLAYVVTTSFHIGVSSEIDLARANFADSHLVDHHAALLRNPGTTFWQRHARSIQWAVVRAVIGAIIGVLLVELIGMASLSRAFDTLMFAALIGLGRSLINNFTWKAVICVTAVLLVLFIKGAAPCPVNPDGYPSDLQAYINATRIPERGFDGAHPYTHLCLRGHVSTQELAPTRDDSWVVANGIDREDPLMMPIAAVAIGPVCACAIPVVSASTFSNDVVAVTNRACMDTPIQGGTSEQRRANLLVWKALAAWAFGLTSNLFRSRVVDGQSTQTTGIDAVVPTPWDRWVGRFTGSAQRILNASRIELLADLGVLKTLRTWQTAAFTKIEAILKAYLGQFTEFAPRLIQGCSSTVKVAFGPWFHAASKCLMELWHTKHEVFYACGRTAEELGQWFKDALEDAGGWSYCRVYKCDANRCDAHVSDEALQYEQSVYKRIMSAPRRLFEYFRRQFTTVGRTPHGVKFGTGGRRRSGDPNTSLGNSIIVGSIARYAAYVCGARFVRIAVIGDDCVVIVNRECHLRLQEVFASFGLSTRPEECARKCDVTFCSGRFWPTETGYVYGPLPGRVLAKLGWAVQYPANSTLVQRRKHLRGVLLGLVRDTAHVPFVSEFVARLLHLTQGVEVRAIITPHRVHASEKYSYSEETFVWLQDLYGLGPESLLAWSDFLQSWTTPTVVYGSPIIERVIEVDL